MSRGKERLRELYGDDHPGFGSYLECMTRANLTGLSTFTIAFSFSYLTQNLLKHKLPYSTKVFILTSSVFGAFLTYTVVKDKTKDCHAAWLAAEEKVTYLTEIEKSPSSS